MLFRSQECKLDQSTKETTRGAGEARRTEAGSTAREGRQHGKHRDPHRHSEEHQTNRDNEPTAPKKARRHEHHRAAQEKKHKTDKEKEDGTDTVVERHIAQDQSEAK